MINFNIVYFFMEFFFKYFIYSVLSHIFIWLWLSSSSSSCKLSCYNSSRIKPQKNIYIMFLFVFVYIFVFIWCMNIINSHRLMSIHKNQVYWWWSWWWSCIKSCLSKVLLLLPCLHFVQFFHFDLLRIDRLCAWQNIHLLFYIFMYYILSLIFTYYILTHKCYFY